MGIKKNDNSDNQTKRSYHLITKRSHKQEMLHILTIPVRKIMHAYIRNSKESIKYWYYTKLPFKKGANLVIIWGFLHFIFWKKNLYLYFIIKYGK